MSAGDCVMIIDYGMRWLKLPAERWNCVAAPRALAEAYGAGFVCTSAGETLERREELRARYAAMQAAQVQLHAAQLALYSDDPPPDKTDDATNAEVDTWLHGQLDELNEMDKYVWDYG